MATDLGIPSYAIDRQIFMITLHWTMLTTKLSVKT